MTEEDHLVLRCLNALSAFDQQRDQCILVNASEVACLAGHWTEYEACSSISAHCLAGTALNRRMLGLCLNAAPVQAW